MAATAAFSLSWSSTCFTQQRQRVDNGEAASMRIVAQKKAKKIRKIILKEDMTELGKKGDLLEVKAGFFRNYLLPLGKAQILTPLLLKEMKIEEERIEAEKKRGERRGTATSSNFRDSRSFQGETQRWKRKADFRNDLVDIIKAQLQRDVDKRIVSLPEIRETGEYIAEIKLHPEVTAQVKLNVFAN